MDSGVPSDNVAKKAKTDQVSCTNQFAWVLYLLIHEHDKDGIDKHGKVPRRIYTSSHKSYISCRTTVPGATLRTQELFAYTSSPDDSFIVLRIQFTEKGFCHYATSIPTSVVPPGTPFLYKLAYSGDCSKDWGAWAFHADLPMEHKDANGAVLLKCEWQ